MICKPSISSEPYTHAAHATKCSEAAQAREVLVQHVQAKRGPIIYCAVIKAAYTVPNGPDCWTIETVWPEKIRITVLVRNVIACGGQTCSCEPIGASERAERAAASPDSGDGASNTSLTAQK